MGPLLPLRRFIPPKALCPSTVLCPSTAHCTLWPFVSSIALCPLCGPLFPLRPSVPSAALWKTAKQAKRLLLFREMFCKTRLVKTPRVICDLFCISDNWNYCDNHDYRSSEILSDNRKIAMFTLAKKVAIYAINHIQQEAIILFREKLKTPNKIWN
jgi:hypothetical protein